jgi:hypothetical protein
VPPVITATLSFNLDIIASFIDGVRRGRRAVRGGANGRHGKK